MSFHSEDSPVPLEYSPARPPTNWTPLFVSSLVGLTVICLFICIRIEVYNHAAGGVLPKTEAGKWRVSFAASEPSWRRMQATITQDPSWNNRTLTPAERSRMLTETTYNQTQGALRDFVGTFGLLQYALVPVTLVLSGSLLSRRRSGRIRLVATVCGCTALGCGFMMIVRDYFGSLGW